MKKVFVLMFMPIIFPLFLLVGLGIVIVEEFGNMFDTIIDIMTDLIKDKY